MENMTQEEFLQKIQSNELYQKSKALHKEYQFHQFSQDGNYLNGQIIRKEDSNGTYDELAKADYDDDIKAGYIRLEVTDRYVGPDTFAYFSEKYPLLLEMKGLDYSEEGAEITLTMEEFEEKSKDPEEIFRSFCAENNLELTEDNISLFKEILNEMAEEA